MGKDLIIVESPAKVKTIRKFLGSGYMVEASVGHVRDLPSSSLGVDEANGFAPQYEVIADKERIVSALRQAAEKSDTVYLAPDPDREGEAIAWHVAELLKDKAKNLRRIQFNEITARAVKEALQHPRDLNADLFHAQQARRILDRLVGYKISPLLWKTVKRGISAGRVQSVALRLIVDRESERMAFDPKEYWVFRAFVGPDAKAEPFRADLFRVGGKKAEISCQAEADAIEAAIAGLPFTVSSAEQKRRERAPLAPFTTSTLQQTANQRLGYTAKRTMSVAQRLYEGVEMQDGNIRALITYMRTDSTRVADEAQAAAAAYVEAAFGRDFLPPEPRIYKARASAQDAHEAIRPVDVSVDPESVRASLSPEQYSLYRLIWSRFLASQMASAVFMDTQAVIACGETEWQAKGQRELFAGWQAVYPSGEKDAELPALTAGQELCLSRVEKEQKFTQPPARYSEAALVRTLEELGIGRPSTYATIISTLEDRGYVAVADKRFAPTDLGRVVCEQLVSYFPQLMDVTFTAGMEESLDEVAEGSKTWDGVLAGFADQFNPMLTQASKEMASKKGGIETGMACPECGKPLVIRFGKAGEFLACTAYPECRFTSNYSRDEKGSVVIAPREERQLEVIGTCPDCGKPLVVKKTRTNSRFVACSGYPDCHYAAQLSTGVACPKCGTGEMVEKSTKRGKLFFSCSRYPQCDFALWDRPIPEACPECGNPYLVSKRTRTGVRISCPNRECDYGRDAAEGEGEVLRIAAPVAPALTETADGALESAPAVAAKPARASKKARAKTEEGATAGKDAAESPKTTGKTTAKRTAKRAVRKAPDDAPAAALAAAPADQAAAEPAKKPARKSAKKSVTPASGEEPSAVTVRKSARQTVRNAAGKAAQKPASTDEALEDAAIKSDE